MDWKLKARGSGFLQHEPMPERLTHTLVGPVLAVGLSYRYRWLTPRL